MHLQSFFFGALLITQYKRQISETNKKYTVRSITLIRDKLTFSGLSFFVTTLKLSDLDQKNAKYVKRQHCRLKTISCVATIQ